MRTNSLEFLLRETLPRLQSVAPISMPALKPSALMRSTPVIQRGAITQARNALGGMEQDWIQ